MGSLSTLEIRRLGRLAWITLNRPDRANTINRALTVAFNDALTELDADSEVRVVLVTGAGDRHFCAGADLREIEQLIDADGTVGDPREDFIRHLETIGKPVIAVINGAALGGGCELALACDFRFLSRGASIGLPEIRFGALPAGGGTQRLPRLVGPARAKAMIMTGEPLSAGQALAIGLVDQVVDADRLVTEAEAFAGVLASRAPYAMVAAKKLLNAAGELPLDEGLALERHTTSTMGSPEEREAARAESAREDVAYRSIFGDS